MGKARLAGFVPMVAAIVCGMSCDYPHLTRVKLMSAVVDGATKSDKPAEAEQLLQVVKTVASAHGLVPRDETSYESQKGTRFHVRVLLGREPVVELQQLKCGPFGAVATADYRSFRKDLVRELKRHFGGRIAVLENQAARQDA